MENIARHHHFIPQFYLDGFTITDSSRSQIHVIDKMKKLSFKTSIRNVGGIRDFNRIDIEGHSIDSVEKAYSEFEGHVKPVLKYIDGTKSLPIDDDFSILMQFVALIGVRNPQIRENIGGVQKQIAEAFAVNLVSTQNEYEKILERMKERGKTLKNNTSYEQMKDFIENKRYKIHIPNEIFILLEFKSLKMILPFLFERNWTLLVTTDDIGNFILCDRPLTLSFSENKNYDKFFGPGFAVKGTELIFPINKDIALLGIYEELPFFSEIDEKIVAIINGRTMNSADRFIYSSRLDFKYMNNEGKICNGLNLVK